MIVSKPKQHDKLKDLQLSECIQASCAVPLDDLVELYFHPTVRG